MLIGSAKMLSLAFGLLALLGGSATARQFSADLVISGERDQPKPATGKVYVGNGFVRIETSDFGTGQFLVNSDADSAVFVMPTQRIFMAAKQSSWLTQILIPVDPNNPCSAWRIMAKVAGATDQGAHRRCRRLGVEAVSGRSTIKYRAILPQGQADYGWIDPQLSFPIRFRRHDGATVELVNIRERPQPEELFEIPAGFHKFDPQQLIERIKQSDVWVAPSN